jgi:hypothetical protein
MLSSPDSQSWHAGLIPSCPPSYLLRTSQCTSCGCGGGRQGAGRPHNDRPGRTSLRPSSYTGPNQVSRTWHITTLSILPKSEFRHSSRRVRGRPRSAETPHGQPDRAQTRKNPPVYMRVWGLQSLGATSVQHRSSGVTRNPTIIGKPELR